MTTSTGANDCAVESRVYRARFAATPDRMEQHTTPPNIPKDATESTAQQREQQEQLDRQNEDPDAPARLQSRRQIADET